MARLLALFIALLCILTAQAQHERQSRTAADPVVDNKPLSAWIEALKDTRLEVRTEAMCVMWKVGPKAKAAVPVLVELAKDANADTAWIACQVLGSIGPDAYSAVPVLAAVLGGPCEDARRFEEVSGLISELDNELFDVRRAALRKLQSLGRTALPALRQAAKGQHSTEVQQRLRDLLEIAEKQEYRVRYEAAVALREIGTKARPALPVLLWAFEDRSSAIAEVAATALAGVGEVAPLIKALKAPTRERRILAAKACYFARNGEDLIASLVQALKDEEPEVRRWSVRALGNYGPQAEAAVPALMEAAKNYGDEFDMDIEACRALGKIGHPVDEINGLKMTLSIGQWKENDKVNITVAYLWTKRKKTWTFMRPWHFIEPAFWDGEGRLVESRFRSDPIGWGEGFREGKQDSVEVNLTVPVPKGAVFISVPDGSGLETKRIRIPAR